MNNITKNINDINNLNDLLVYFKQNLLESINTSSLAFFNKVISPFNEKLGYQIISVKPFPLSNNEAEYEVLAYVFNKAIFNNNEKVLILFTDKNFITNLNINKPATNNYKDRHSKLACVAIKFNESDQASKIPVDYSLQEVNTGIKWINGKDIYRKVVQVSNIVVSPFVWVDVFDKPQGLSAFVNGTCINSYGSVMPMAFDTGITTIRIMHYRQGVDTLVGTFIIEYTK